MIHEVLEAEAPELIELLLDVSVVDRVNTSLAAALTGRSDADAMLRRAEGRGLFVSMIDPIGWFELHSVARAALLAELERRTPHLSGCAAAPARRRWFEEADEVVLALGQYLLAGRAARRSDCWRPNKPSSTTPGSRSRWFGTERDTRRTR